MGKWKVKPRSKKNALEETKAKKKAAALKSTPPVWPTKSGFKRWLSQMDNRIVGRTCLPTQCALAKYTASLNPPKTRIGMNSLVSCVGSESRSTPEWMFDFMCKFDQLGKRGAGIKGKDALGCFK